MLSKQLPIARESFEEIIKGDFYYVDKTSLISDLLNNLAKVNLFTRPRRFGKTLTMSMMKYFFEIGTDKSLFDGLSISNEKGLCEQYMGNYPVVSISLKQVEGSTFEAAYGQLRTIIREEAFRLKVLRDSSAIDEDERDSYNKIRMGKDDVIDIKNSIKMFSNLLEKHYGQKVIVLIDEYDVPLDKAYENGYYDKMMEIIRAMLGAALKTNDSLFFAVLTGCLRVSKESIFTGLNNLVVHSISDERFDEYFGFTESEVKRMLKAYNLESHFDEMRQWYDGYRFGEQEIYCPWDVIYHCYALRMTPNVKPAAYWANSSETKAVRKLIEMVKDGTARKEIETLISGGTINKRISEQLTHNEIYDDINNMWSLLYMTGYLTISQAPNDGVYNLRIPNYEVQQIFKNQVLDWFSAKAKTNVIELMELFDLFKKADFNRISEYLSDRLSRTISYYDEKESFYHGFLVGLLTANPDWSVSSNDEVGNGRADIIVEDSDGQFGFVVELKVVKDIDKMDSICELAMKQIEEKDYTFGLRESRIKKILAYAITFCGKRCKVIVKEEM